MKFSSRTHILFWAGYILFGVIQLYFSYFATPVPNSYPADFSKWEFVKAFIYAALIDIWPKALFFYSLHFLVIRPLFYEKRKDAAPLISGILLTFIFTLIVRAINFYIIFPEIYRYQMEGRNFFNVSSLTMTMFDTLLPACVLTIYELYRYTKITSQKAYQLEKEKLRSELSYLKAQINPHFLFNVLSTVHSLSRKDAPDAANVVLKLSELMRFMLYEVKNKWITIESEIRFLEGLIELERIRYRDKLDVKFEVDIDDETVTIAPMILLPFVENAFKHGAAESRFYSFIHIYLKVKKHFLSFSAENSVEPAETDTDNMGIGLINVRRQLELIYPEHDLKLYGQDGKFIVELNLNLTKYAETIMSHH